MELFFFWLIMAVVVAFVANSKGRSPGLWLLYGLVIWPIALIHAIVMTKTVEALEQEKQKQGNIRCPNCADWVYKDAKTCPHCQHRLTATAKARVPSATLSKTVKENLIVENAEDVWQGERNLDAAKYKLFLSEKYDIKKNDLFEKYVCLDEMFDTLDDALAHADKTDRQDAATKAEACRKTQQEQKQLAATLVKTGKIGSTGGFTYQEFASGEVLVTHVAGASKRFDDLTLAQVYLNAYSETQALLEMKKDQERNQDAG